MEDNDNHGGYNEISDHGISPFEKMDLGIESAIESCASKVIDIAGGVIEVGFSIVGGAIKGLFG